MTHLKIDPALAPSSLLFRMNADPSALWEQIDDYARSLPNTPAVVKEAAAEVAAEINRRVPAPSHVEAPEIDRGELLRGRLTRAYHAHHGSWPQGAYITDTIAAFEGKFSQPESAAPTERAKVLAGFHTVARATAEEWNRKSSVHGNIAQLGRAKIALDEISAAEPLATGGDEPRCAAMGTCKAEDGSGTCYGCGRFIERELEPIRERLRALRLVGPTNKISDEDLDQIIYAVRGL